MIEIEKITLYHLSMNLKKPFKNSIETLQERKFLIVEA
ncbi:o-succinylbenzoate synthase, partial [Pseudomonas sp. GW456-E7]